MGNFKTIRISRATAAILTTQRPEPMSPSRLLHPPLQAVVISDLITVSKPVLKSPRGRRHTEPIPSGNPFNRTNVITCGSSIWTCRLALAHARFFRHPRGHEVVGTRNRIRGLVDRGAYVLPADAGTMDFDELNCNGDSREPNHYPHTMQWDNTVSTGFQLVRDEHNQARITDPANPENQIQNPYRGIIWVTSTYRCPIWNRHEGGDPASRHMAGDAFDWDNNGRGTVVDTSQDWTESRRNWYVARSAQRADFGTARILLYRSTDRPSNEQYSWRTLEDLIANDHGPE